MSLERKDVRFKVHPDVHQALAVLAEVRGVDIGEYVESIVARDVLKEVHEANVVAQRTAGLGISGKSRESLGASDK